MAQTNHGVFNVTPVPDPSALKLEPVERKLLELLADLDAITNSDSGIPAFGSDESRVRALLRIMATFHALESMEKLSPAGQLQFLTKVIDRGRAR